MAFFKFFSKEKKETLDRGLEKTKTGVFSKIKRAFLGRKTIDADFLDELEEIFITGDVKYHDFTSSNHRIIIANIGHYESEQYTKEIFADIIASLHPDFEVKYANEEQNQVKYI